MAFDITFMPRYGGALTVVTSAASGTTKFDGIHSQSMQLTNLGSVTVYVRVGKDTLGDASIADSPVLAGTQVSITKADDADAISYISPDGAGSLHFMAGEGF